MQLAVVVLYTLQDQMRDTQDIDAEGVQFGVVHQIDPPKIMLEEIQKPLDPLN